MSSVLGVVVMVWCIYLMFNLSTIGPVGPHQGGTLSALTWARFSPNSALMRIRKTGSSSYESTLHSRGPSVRLNKFGHQVRSGFCEVLNCLVGRGFYVQLSGGFTTM